MQDQIITSSKPFMICKYWYETSTMETNQNIWTKIGNPFPCEKIMFTKNWVFKCPLQLMYILLQVI
jgi:hypothetical protein